MPLSLLIPEDISFTRPDGLILADYMEKKSSNSSFKTDGRISLGSILFNALEKYSDNIGIKLPLSAYTEITGRLAIEPGKQVDFYKEKIRMGKSWSHNFKKNMTTTERHPKGPMEDNNYFTNHSLQVSCSKSFCNSLFNSVLKGERNNIEILPYLSDDNYTPQEHIIETLREIHRINNIINQQVRSNQPVDFDLHNELTELWNSIKEQFNDRQIIAHLNESEKGTNVVISADRELNKDSTNKSYAIAGVNCMHIFNFLWKDIQADFNLCDSSGKQFQNFEDFLNIYQNREIDLIRYINPGRLISVDMGLFADNSLDSGLQDLQEKLERIGSNHRTKEYRNISESEQPSINLLERALEKNSQDVWYQCAVDENGYRSNVGHILERDAELKLKLVRHLDEIGIRNYEYLASGGGAIVLDTGRNQVIKIGSGVVPEKKCRFAEFLQPVHSFETVSSSGTKIFLDVFPKVKLLNRENGFSDDEIKNYSDALKKSLAEKGYTFDNGFEYGANVNIGLIEDLRSPAGYLPVIIDHGALDKLEVSHNQAGKIHSQKDLKEKLETPYSFKWEGKQKWLSKKGVLKTASSEVASVLKETMSALLKAPLPIKGR